MKSLGKAALLASTLSLSNCGDHQECSINGGSIRNIDGPGRALEVCNQNRQLVMKCIKEEGTNGDLVIASINCAAQNYEDQITSAFSNSDYTTCTAGTGNDTPTASCK